MTEKKNKQKKINKEKYNKITNIQKIIKENIIKAKDEEKSRKIRRTNIPNTPLVQ